MPERSVSESQPGLNVTDIGPLPSALNHFVEKSFGVLFLSAFSALKAHDIPRVRSLVGANSSDYW